VEGFFNIAIETGHFSHFGSYHRKKLIGFVKKKFFITDVSLHKEVPVKFWKSLEFEVRMRA